MASAGPTSHRVATSVSAHAWNADCSMLAVAPNSSEIWVYANVQEKSTKNWVKKWTLKNHDMLVSGLDWNPVTNKIVSCAHDRSAFVWNYDEAADDWTATVTVLRLPRACTCVKWSPNGSKLAVGSSAKLVPVLYYEAEYNWWVGKQIKTHKSTVTDLAWHPDGMVLATASTDFCCRLFSTYMPEVDTDGDGGGMFGDSVGPLGTVLLEFNQAKAWVHAVSWSPSGTQLAFAAHNSTVFFVTWGAGGVELDPVPSSTLPNRALCWLSDSALVAAGHDMNPQLYTLDAGSGLWHCVGNVDAKDKGEGKGKTGVAAARAMFASKVSKGQDAAATSGDKLATKHTAAIGGIAPMFGAAGASSTPRFSTCSVDGRVVKWNVAGAKLELDMAALSLA